ICSQNACPGRQPQSSPRPQSTRRTLRPRRLKLFSMANGVMTSLWLVLVSTAIADALRQLLGQRARTGGPQRVWAGAVRDRGVARGLSGFVACVDSRAVLHEKPDDRLGAARLGGAVQRGVAGAVGGIDVGAERQAQRDRRDGIRFGRLIDNRQERLLDR